MVQAEGNRLSIEIGTGPPDRKNLARLLLASRESLYLQELEPLEREALVAYHCDAACRAGAEVTLVSALNENGSYAGTAAVRALEWDSDLLKRRVASIDFLVTDRRFRAEDAACLYRALLQEARSHCRRNGIDVIFFRNSMKNAGINEAIACLPAEPLSALVSMYRPYGSGDLQAATADAQIRPASPSDFVAVEGIMAAGYQNRLLKDPLFDHSSVRTLYRAWIKNDLAGRVEGVLVAKAEGSVRGFVAYDRKEIGGKVFSFIDMIVVDPNCRGGGIGTSLMMAAMSSLSDQAEGCFLGVEEQPEGPVAFYRRLGFSRLDTMFSYHLRPD